ncbi:MAG TPA: ribonuclease P protein component [Bacteroidales bacterium]|nr:ribonuclease P protein component [Bacteroidales bacterium]
MPNLHQTFTKGERLCSRKAIEELFTNGSSFYYSPFQFIWTKTENEIPFPAQVAVSVSKRGFKKAVDRNLIKRRMREAWRKHKHILYEFLETKKIRIVFIIIYKDSSILPFGNIDTSLKKATDKLLAEISSKTTNC